MTDLSTPTKIKELLHQACGNLESFEQCALLDYPDYFNIGDHLIWLGTVFYLTDVLKTKINYTASIKDFSGELMEQKVGKSPIFLNGGGNLGDLWLPYQQFREYIISHYQDRPVIILPQTIYFENKENLINTAKIFNSHPNLTLFVRDDYSYEIAHKFFHNCRIIKAPDMAFQMVNMPELGLPVKQNKTILYHCRQDREFNKRFSPDLVNLPNLVVEDWISYQWITREMLTSSSALYWKLPGMVKLVREGWQQRLSRPSEWLSRNQWQGLTEYKNKFNAIYKPERQLESWSLLHSGIYQFKRHQLVITNRLHGHILCLLLEIPHVFLSNSYHKNDSFYETWTSQIPFCRFIKDASQINGAVQELREKFIN
jgi:exopolysaccharide biosynthesis predicted pyruvyltransferase EpsI